jgi:D-serine deaminase-like pyridoxal phosphate-dependent protein
MNLTRIVAPTLLVDRDRASANIARMAEKARSQRIRFRPHFKTHQSAAVGEWFRPYGVSAITVSSLEMAAYFARNGWDDILVAFPLNLRQLDLVDDLSSRIRLGVLVESVQAVETLGRRVGKRLNVWLKVDSGSGRTGIDWRDGALTLEIWRTISSFSQFTPRGLLTHAGYTYSACSVEEVRRRYQESGRRMTELKRYLNVAQSLPVEISVGDTPGCSLCENLGPVDEIRPGNFVFYDAQMLRLGVCRWEEVAAAVACPVVALHPGREEALIYGGAVHLSKDYLVEDGITKYGYVVPLTGNGWGEPIEGAYVARLSQEHGVLHLPKSDFDRLQIGGLIGIIPAHVCLTVSALDRYWTTDGEAIATLNCA